MSLPDDAVEARTAEEWRAWLAANHAQKGGVWLVMPCRGEFGYDAAVNEAICFGWIDSTPRALDGARTMRRMAPRKPRSGWSRVNKARVERLIAEGRMHPAGLAKIDAAKADGSWNALDEVEDLVVPDDLAAALAALPPAEANFAVFPRTACRAILEWVGSAKRPETRAARVREAAEKAQRNERANAWRPSSHEAPRPGG